MFARRAGDGRWVPVYIGQGNLKEQVSDKIQVARARKKGASHILARTNPNEQLRRVEAHDMLAGHPEACAPTGCNENKSVTPAPLRIANKRD
jgi:hypothetical protein